MKIQCPNCSILNNIDETKALDKGGYVQCNECKTEFLIWKDSGICPLCGHNRKINDVECPNCGILYEKYEEYLNKKKTQEEPGIQEEPKIQETLKLKEKEGPDNKSTLKFRSTVNKFLTISFSFCLLFGIYHFLILPIFVERTKLNEELRLKEELRSNEEIEKNKFNNAYVALMKIEVATRSEIILQKYINLIDSATLELNLIKDNNSVRFNKLNEIYDCYQSGNQLWTLIDLNEQSKNLRIAQIKNISKQEQATLKRNYDDQTYKAKYNLDLKLALIGEERNQLNAYERKSVLKLKYLEDSAKVYDELLNAQIELENKKYQETIKIINDTSIEKADKEKTIQLLWKKASEMLREYETN